jgi:hypothetical protein
MLKKLFSMLIREDIAGDTKTFPAPISQQRPWFLLQLIDGLQHGGFSAFDHSSGQTYS